MDGRVYVWKITEEPDEDDKPQITGKIVTAVQIAGEGEPVHPRVCWHCHKQVKLFSNTSCASISVMAENLNVFI